ncbi:MAG: C13 family peptidase [Pseudomonadota bacterium]
MSLLRNLGAGLKLALMSPSIQISDFRRSLVQPVLLVAVVTVALTLISYSQQSGEIYFNDLGALTVAYAIFALLVVALTAAGLHKQYDALPGLLTALSASLFWVVLAAVGFAYVEFMQTVLVRVLLLLWTIAVICRAINVSFSTSSGIAYIVAATTVVVFAMAAFYRGYSPAMFWSWDEADYEDMAAYTELDQESTFYNQDNLLKPILDAIDVGDPNEQEWYFVGFAGNGDERVFGSEVRFAEDRVSQVFGTEGRSLVLAADIDRVDSAPLANTHNLYESIKSIGEKMDDDDVLFLFLTSHGSEDASMQVALYPFPLRQLTAVELRSALDMAEIEWRVIVLSACYSGSFMDQLKTEKTIVVTAAAADKTSFGCSSNRELTYFGQAFFKESMSEGGSIVDWFDQARSIVEKWEADKDLPFSDPQIYVGDEIRQKLAAQAMSSADE